MRQVLVEDAKISNEKLAVKCGFGSVSSMKRAVYAKSSLTISDMKMKILNTDNRLLHP
jgi:transcriptional regulator GlxA family with amidase domain